MRLSTATLTRCLTALAIASLLQPTLVHAKRRDGDHDKGGIPAVLAKLERIERRLEQNAAEVDELRTEVRTLDANLTPCTLERFQAGLCGPDNHPLDLLVSVCAGVGAGTGLILRYAFSSSTEVQAGIGWKLAPDVHIVTNAQIPGIVPVGVPPALIPVVLPSELSGQVNAVAQLGLDGCLAPIRLPIGKQIAEPVVQAILANLETHAQPVIDRLVDHLNAGGAMTAAASVEPGPGMGLAQVSNALAAADVLRDEAIVDDNAMASFGRGALGGLAGVLPVGERMQSILEDPEQLALPGLVGPGGGSGVTTAALASPEGVFAQMCAGDNPIPRPIAPVCNFISERIPGVERVLDLVPMIELIPDVVNEVVDGVRELVAPLLSNVGEAASSTLQRFCNSAVGQRRLFNRLCGR